MEIGKLKTIKNYRIGYDILKDISRSENVNMKMKI